MRDDTRRIVQKLAAKTGVTQALVKRIVLAAGEVVADMADERGECRWPSFGRFRTSDVSGRYTLPVVSWDEEFIEVEVRGRKTLRYKPYRAVRKALNRRINEDGQGKAP